MAATSKLVLDILKPHQPSIIDLAHAIAERGVSQVEINVIEMDEMTETVTMIVEGSALDFDALAAAIRDFGASLHSIDAVVVIGDRPQSTR